MATCVEPSVDVAIDVPPSFLTAAHSRVLQWAIKRVDYDTAHDLANEVAMSVWERRRLDASFLAGPSELDRFVVTAARNALVDRLRRDRRRARRETAYENESRRRRRLWMCPEEQSDYSELSEALHRALARTSPRGRAAYLMVQEEERSYSSAAAALDVSPRTVESRVRRTRIHLREELAEFAVGARVERPHQTHGGSE
jgi:RNA polymerase sigma factor (sigma-70 family)